MMELFGYPNNFNNPGQNPITQDCGWGMMGRYGMMGWWPLMGGGWFGGLFSIVVGILTTLVLIALFRWLWHKGTQEEEKKK